MILQELDILYDRLKSDPSYRIAPYGSSLQKITFKVVLKPDGTLFAIEDARRPDGKKLRSRQVLVPGGAKLSGSGINPGLLWDNAKYMLGFDAEAKDPTRIEHCRVAFRDKHLKLEQAIGSPPFTAVCRFLAAWDPEQAGNYPVLAETTTGFGIFQILGETEFVHDDPAVAAWWCSAHSNSGTEPIGTCLISGAETEIARTHDKIKGVRGGQAAGGALIGFNELAYESYGKKQSYNAPVGKQSAFRYVTALNALLDGPRRDTHRINLPGTTIVFWTDARTITEDVLAGFLGYGSAEPRTPDAQDPTMVRKLAAYLDALRQGRLALEKLESDPENTRFHLLGLSPNAARISMRFYLTGSLSQFLENQRAHFSDILVESDSASEVDLDEFPSLDRLLCETCPRFGGKPDRDKISPSLIGPLFRSIVLGLPYPEGLYAAVVSRLRIDRTMRRLRAGLIKGYLNRNRGKEVPMSLDTSRIDPAYRVGRLFAALEKTQIDALGRGVNATIRDRFYASASATPGIVFPRLMRTYQHHLAKLEGGFRVNRERLVQEIMADLSVFPTRFNLVDQGLFAIGYYHQSRAFFHKKASLENHDDVTNERTAE